ncbi:MAG: hypothetical protein M1587_05425, partial [Thaumarchaeota archaeon]|nr:hypothetical protein [Nitrososphaerota archaeon]
SNATSQCSQIFTQRVVVSDAGVGPRVSQCDAMAQTQVARQKVASELAWKLRDYSSTSCQRRAVAPKTYLSGSFRRITNWAGARYCTSI